VICMLLVGFHRDVGIPSCGMGEVFGVVLGGNLGSWVIVGRVGCTLEFSLQT
jgi:hypothetical protein